MSIFGWFLTFETMSHYVGFYLSLPRTVIPGMHHHTHLYVHFYRGVIFIEFNLFQSGVSLVGPKQQTIHEGWDTKQENVEVRNPNKPVVKQCRNREGKYSRLRMQHANTVFQDVENCRETHSNLQSSFFQCSVYVWFVHMRGYACRGLRLQGC